jgi:hypothetical protein
MIVDNDNEKKGVVFLKKADSDEDVYYAVNEGIIEDIHVERINLDGSEWYLDDNEELADYDFPEEANIKGIDYIGGGFRTKVIITEGGIFEGWYEVNPTHEAITDEALIKELHLVLDVMEVVKKRYTQTYYEAESEDFNIHEIYHVIEDYSQSSWAGHIIVADELDDERNYYDEKKRHY